MNVSFRNARWRSFGALLALLLGSAACGGENLPSYPGVSGSSSSSSGGWATTPHEAAGGALSGVPSSANAGSPNGGTDGGEAGADSGGTVAAGAASTPGGSASSDGYPTTCEDLGKEPVIPPACTTLTATKSVSVGVLSDETTLDTERIQAAIAACPAGQSVKLSADGEQTAFLSGALNLKSGVSLWVDAGVTLYASRNPRDFDAKPNQCGLGTGGSSNCYALINASVTTGSGVVGEGTIDGRGGELIIGQDPPLTWWQLNDKAHLAGNLTAPRLVQTSGGKDFTLYKVHFQNAPKFHIVIGTSGFVVWGITVITDPSSPNTDGVDPSGASNGVIAYTKISTGDDNIAIKGTGQPTDNLIIAHNHFGRGHGMSIGSETNAGVKRVKVCDLSLDGTSNGLRIKSDLSRGGLVQDISYTDVCMRGVKAPLVFDPYYSAAAGTLIPDFRNISLKNVHILGAGASTFSGYDADHVLSVSLDNVVMDDAGSATFKAQNAALGFGPGPVNFSPAGNGVTVTKNITTSAAARDCSAAWVTF